MKYFLIALALLLGVQTASAQNVNCAALSGSPLMCVKNQSPFVIDGIQANTANTFGSQWIRIPGGPIGPGGTSIVNFGNWHGQCRMFVVIHTSSGATHVYPNVDVCRATSFNVTGW